MPAYVWIIYINATGEIVSIGGGSIVPSASDFGDAYSILEGITADPVRYRMNAARDGVELVE